MIQSTVETFPLRILFDVIFRTIASLIDKHSKHALTNMVESLSILSDTMISLIGADNQAETSFGAFSNIKNFVIIKYEIFLKIRKNVTYKSWHAIILCLNLSLYFGFTLFI